MRRIAKEERAGLTAQHSTAQHSTAQHSAAQQSKAHLSTEHSTEHSKEMSTANHTAPGLAERQVLELVEVVAKSEQEARRDLDPQGAEERLGLRVEEGAEAKGHGLLALLLGDRQQLLVQQLEGAFGGQERVWGWHLRGHGQQCFR